MARRLGIVLTTTVVALLVMTDGAWACRCMNRLINRCGHHRVYCCGYVQPICCQPVCCQPVYCQPACCQPACCQPAVGEIKPAPDAATVAPSTTNPGPAPELAPPPAPKPEVKPPVAGPAEVPAEQRVAPKPEVKPADPVKPAEPVKAPEPPKVLEPPKVPDAPKLEAPKPADVAKPDLKPEAQPDLPKPEPKAEPKAEPKPEPKPEPKAEPKPDKPKDDPFQANDNAKTLRMWSDASGKYQIEARFVSFQDGSVRLQKANGRYVRVAYDLLSSLDQNFVINQDRSLLAMEQ